MAEVVVFALLKKGTHAGPAKVQFQLRSNGIGPLRFVSIPNQFFV